MSLILNVELIVSTKSMILKPRDSCVLLSAFGALIICLVFLGVNLVSDKN